MDTSRQKQRAHAAVAAAANRGVIKYSPCCICGGTYRIHMHHYDYSRPLHVVPLCNPCHGGVHSRRLVDPGGPMGIDAAVAENRIRLRQVRGYHGVVLSKIIKEAVASGISYLEIAEGVGIDLATISVWKSGHTVPKTKNLIAFCDVIKLKSDRRRELALAVGLDPEVLAVGGGAP